jgi:uncharacterized protein (UPF0276 family)
MIGVSYFSALDPLLDAEPGLVDVLEIEPQTFWFQPDQTRAEYRVDSAGLERLRARPQPKLVHSVAAPVGGTRPPPAGQIHALQETIAVLEPTWASEHLSFNAASGPDGSFNTGFLLPPRQTVEGVACAARSIAVLRDQIAVPLAVETGVNYLRPRADELPDGAFVGAVVERADCGILLDLHNLWCNQRNGRQRIDEFLAQIPLERVWEVHLAGGSPLGDYWVDSHAGPVPPGLVPLAAEILPRLPNLRAVIFELFPEYLPRFGLEAIAAELRLLRGLLPKSITPHRAPMVSLRSENDPSGPSPAEWEDTLGALAVSQPVTSTHDAALVSDPGIELLRDLIGSFRGSMVTGVLKLTVRLLLLTLGGGIDDLLGNYFRTTRPALFASAEAATFAGHLRQRALAVPYLDDVLGFETAVMQTLLDGHERVVPFSVDPIVLLRALGEGRLPDGPRRGRFEVAVTPPSTSESTGQQHDQNDE